MGQFYIDDSVHDEAGFVLGACVYTDNELTDKIDNAIRSNGFDPATFEFKSSTNYSKEADKAKVRQELKRLLFNHCRLGVTVIPRQHRDLLGYECIKALKQFIDNNRINAPTQLFFDQGMFSSKQTAYNFINKLNFSDCQFFIDQNSRDIKGIQVADLAAHSASIQLKHQLGLAKKMVKAGKNSGYDPEMELELGFEMWASLRFIFFNEGPESYEHDPIENSTVMVEPYGLYVSELCNKDLADTVRKSFSTVYLGCIH